MYEIQEPMESEPEEGTKDEQAEDVETSQSEIVETHVLPEDSDPEEMNAQVKRPRRRRRRRRRKRPKPTASPEELEAYYTVPEEEIKRKPIKYRPQEEGEEAAPESSTVPRRRNAKRRRRPLKRPPTVEDYPATVEGYPENANNTEESQPPEQQPIEEHPDETPKATKPHIIEVTETEPPPPKPQLPIVARKAQVKNENEPIVFKDNPKLLRPKESDFTKPLLREEPSRRPQESIVDDTVEENDYSKFDSGSSKPKSKDVAIPEIRKEVEPPKDDQGGNSRRRKRPPFKSDPAEPSAKADQLEPKVAESVDTKNQVQAIRKNEVKIDDEVKINLVEQRKYKIDERVKQSNDTSKKDAFKLRRLPPISAILRHAKNRPKNETATTKAPQKSDTFKIKESITNEILTHAATLDQIDQRLANETEEEPEPPVAVVPTTSTARTEKTEKPTTSTSRPQHKASHFEFPIIAYTEQKQKQSTAASTSTSASTTESTAFIYIPCNHTIKEVFRNTFNFSNHENASKHEGSAKTTEVVTEPQTTTTTTTTTTTPSTTVTTEYYDTKPMFDSVAIKQLEKLLQADMETISATVETVNQTKSHKNITQMNNLLQQLDANALESELNYLFQNGVTSTATYREVKSSTEQNFREPKWFLDTSKHRQQNLSEEKVPILEKANINYDKEIIISYTSTISPTSLNEIDPQEMFHGNELSLHLRNNSYRRVSPDGVMHKNKNYNERKKLPLAVKSAIIISGAILALAVLGFFALLLSCKIRQAKSRMKCHRELYRERFQNSEFRQSSRSTSPVVSKSNYNARNFPNNIQSNVASNRNYYLWQTLRKTFQYD